MRPDLAAERETTVPPAVREAFERLARNGRSATEQIQTEAGDAARALTVRAVPLPDGRMRLSATNPDGSRAATGVAFPDGRVLIDSGRPAIVFADGEDLPISYRLGRWAFWVFGIPLALNLAVLYADRDSLFMRSMPLLALLATIAFGAFVARELYHALIVHGEKQKSAGDVLRLALLVFAFALDLYVLAEVLA